MRLFGRILSALLLALGLAAAASQSSAAVGTDGDEASCLALTLYWEARSEGPKGMAAVAAVVLNRVDHPGFPDSICEVVRQGGESAPCQFSYYCDGRSDRPTEADKWAFAQKLAAAVVARRPHDPTRGALFFHASSIGTPWKRQRERLVQIGRHIYYR